MDEERREELQNGDSVAQWWDQGSFEPALPHSTLASFSDGKQPVSNARATSPQDKIQKKEIKFLAFLWSRETFPRTTPLQTSSHTNSWANHWERDWETFKPDKPTWRQGLIGLTRGMWMRSLVWIIEEETNRGGKREAWREESGLDTGQTSSSIHYNIYMGKPAYGVRKSNYTNWWFCSKSVEKMSWFLKVKERKC